MGPSEIDYVVFDIGGVLVRLAGVPWPQDAAGAEEEEKTWDRWASCPWVRSFEIGECSAEDLASGLVHNWGLEVTPEEFLETFRLFPERLFEGALELTRAVRAWRPLACLSNSNTLHWERISEWGLGTAFDSVFLSHEIGLVKPDREAFEHVIGKLGAPAERVAFFDDNLVNVTAARSVGLLAFQVQGPKEASAVLAGLGMPDGQHGGPASADE